MFLFWLVCLQFFWIVRASEVPTGVPFSALSAYRIGESFTCIRNPLVIPWSKVNDNYCDCPDGSDEPGTSACNKASFFCRDVQYKVMSIPSGYVNDEVVDCCDGSDEYDGRTRHESTCSELAHADQQARSTKRKEIEEGCEIYKHYIKKVEQRKEEERIAAEKAAQERAEAETLEAQRPKESSQEAESVTGKVETGDENAPASDHAEPGDHAVEENEGPETRADSEHHAGENEPVEHDMPTPPPKIIDYGPGEGFRMLLEEPGYLEFTDKQYTYRLYAFEKIYQRDKGSDWSPQNTLLGQWREWSYADDDVLRENKYAVMLFHDGQSCWNGPVRSTRVHVYCDSRNEIRAVEEPSRCVYTMHLHTPAACFDSPDVIYKRLHPDS